MTQDQSIRVLLVDEHCMVRQGIRCLFASTDDVTVVGEAETSEEAKREVDRLRPGVVVVDPTMEDFGGAEAIEDLAEIHAGTKIIVLFGGPERLAAALIPPGAHAYVSKRVPFEALLRTVRDAGAGKSTRMVGARRVPGAAVRVWPPDRLTERELEVLRLLATGLSNRQIADRLGVTPRTIQFHVAHLFAKLRATSRTGAVHQARELGLID